jgi:hypothetical protein
MEPQGSLRVIEESPYYFLSEEPDGYALWVVNGDETDDPVLTFPTGDSGRELEFAFRRETRLGRWSRFFLIVAFVAGPAWIVAEATQRILAMSREALVTPDVFSAQIPTIWLVRAWFSTASSIASAAFEIAVGLSLVIWLHRRYRRYRREG